MSFVFVFLILVKIFRWSLFWFRNLKLVLVL